MTFVVVESPGRDSEGGGFSGTALGRRPQNRAQKMGNDPRTGTLTNGKKKSFSPVRGALAGLLSLAVPVGRSDWPVLVPCRSWPLSRLFVCFFLRRFRAPTREPVVTRFPRPPGWRSIHLIGELGADPWTEQHTMGADPRTGPPYTKGVPKVVSCRFWVVSSGGACWWLLRVLLGWCSWLLARWCWLFWVSVSFLSFQGRRPEDQHFCRYPLRSSGT